VCIAGATPLANMRQTSPISRAPSSKLEVLLREIRVSDCALFPSESNSNR
jgi:hypothetical protein